MKRINSWICAQTDTARSYVLSGLAILMFMTGCTYRVDSLVDAPDANPGDRVCARSIPAGGITTGDDGGLCTLRAAIMEANSSSLGLDSIEIPAGQYNLLLPIAAGGGSLKINSAVKIQGAGAETTIINSEVGDGVIYIQGGNTQINNVTIQGGNNQAGGGIRVKNAELELTDVAVRDNFSVTGGAGIFIEDDTSATIRRSRIISNMANGAFGGGIWNKGDLFVYDSLIAGNDSNRAGGIHNEGNMNLRSSTVSGNTTHSPQAGTGGISQVGFAVLNNVTITNNTGIGSIDNGSFKGGGIQTTAGNTTVLKNSIVAGNNGTNGPDDCVGPLSGDSKFNLIGDSTACDISSHLATYLLDIDPMLGNLNSNGGQTQTHQPQSGSPAIGAGFEFAPGGPAADACEGFDQRGVPRPQGGNPCDLGAVERTSVFAFITGFVLVDSDNDTDIRPLRYGDTLYLDELPANFTIRAQLTGSAGSVVFDLDDQQAIQTENMSPYALAGDANGDFHPLSIDTSEHTLLATPFAGTNGSGAAGGSFSIRFAIQNSLQ